MPVTEHHTLLIPFPQRINLSVLFDLDTLNTERSFDHLDTLWEEITLVLSTALIDRGITVLDGKTEVDKSENTIAYKITVLAIPPYIHFSFLYEELVDNNLPSQLTITTPNHYNPENCDIVLKST